MFLISFWQVLVFLIVFFIIKTNQEWGIILYNPWQSKLKLKHMKNPSFGELRSLCQINQVCKEENQRRNLTSSNLAWLCEIFAKHAKFSQSMWNAKRNTSCRTESKTVKNEFPTLCKISQALRNQRLRKMNFAPCAKFHKPCENPLV